MAKAKVQITVDEDLLRDVDDYCDKNYMNRSWLISQALLQVISQQKVIDSMFNVSLAMKKVAESGNLDEESKKEMETFQALCKMFVQGK